MSRSFKKNPYATRFSKKWTKRIVAKRFRLIIRQKVKPWKYRYSEWSLECDCEYDYDYENETIELRKSCFTCRTQIEPEFPHPFEITNPALVCDYRFYSSDPRDRRK